MDPALLAKWPNVPACFEWLALDRRGQWRLKGEVIAHRGLITFLNLNYGVDDTGRWFVQNGPQRVFVDLAYSPWVFHRAPDGSPAFISHTGRPAGNLRALHLDAEGNLLLDTELGPGLLDDRDLAPLLAECSDSTGHPVSDDALAALLAGETPSITWHTIPLTPLPTVDLEKHFNFVRTPREAG